jgi:hypothetical protein
METAAAMEGEWRLLICHTLIVYGDCAQVYEPLVRGAVPSLLSESKLNALPCMGLAGRKWADLLYSRNTALAYRCRVSRMKIYRTANQIEIRPVTYSWGVAVRLVILIRRIRAAYAAG